MASTTGTCTSCGMPKDPSAAFCVHCGAPAAASASGAPAPQPPPPPEPPTPPPPPPPTASSAAASSAAQNTVSLTQRGFFASLFDVSFTSLVMTKIIRVLYILSMIWIGFYALVFIIAAFHTGETAGLVVLFIIAPAISLLFLIYTRLVLEISIAIFRIMENTSELVAQSRRS